MSRGSRRRVKNQKKKKKLNAIYLWESVPFLLSQVAIKKETFLMSS